jgi:hypothetical protein
MKRFPLLLPLVAVVVAAACMDSTSPANSRASLTPGNPTPDLFGDPPPPPVDVAMEISISSPSLAIFTGVYFSNGKICDDGSCSEPTFDGTAWLRLDNNNKQPTPGGTATPNTRFMVKDADPPTGMGTLCFGGTGTDCSGGIAYKIVRVDEFTAFNGCGALVPGDPCAIITFKAEVVNGPHCDLDSEDPDPNCHEGSLVAFNKLNCLRFNSDGGFYYILRSCFVPPPPIE